MVLNNIYLPYTQNKDSSPKMLAWISTFLSYYIVLSFVGFIMIRLQISFRYLPKEKKERITRVLYSGDISSELVKRNMISCFLKVDIVLET